MHGFKTLTVYGYRYQVPSIARMKTMMTSLMSMIISLMKMKNIFIT